MAFFLDEPPANSAVTHLPPEIRDAFIAKVRILGLSSYPGRVSPGKAGERRPPPPPYIVRAEIEVSETLAGPASVGNRYRVEFGPGDVGGRYITPLLPDRQNKQYFVVSFVDANGTRTLLGFPVSDSAFRKWWDTFLERSKGPAQ